MAAGIALSLCAVFFSCGRTAARTPERGTELSRTIDDAREKAVWAYEIEGARLSRRISSVNAIDGGIALSPLVLIALEGGTPFPQLFPKLEGFTSLDTTDIKGDVLDTVEGFCRALIERTSPSHADVLLEGNGNSTAEKTGESAAQEDSSKIDGYFSERTLYSLVLFLSDIEDFGAVKSFVVGRPFVDEVEMEVPIRLSCEKGAVYVLAYPVPCEESWKIQQIEVYKVEEQDGKTHGN